MQQRHPPTARPALTRERVLRVAIDLADRGGIASLSMRRLASALGVEAMSLYHHVANKDDLLAGIVDIVVGEIALPDPREDWKVGLRMTAVSAYDVLGEHRWTAELMLASDALRPARMRYMNAVLGSLRRAGFSAGMTDHAYHALDSHILGFTLWEVGLVPDPGSLQGLATDALAELSSDDYPHLVEHIRQHLLPRDADAQPEFEFGLDLILDGLERILRATEAGNQVG
jgi:AcrR family transcriptional regulator